ncbi:response regulator [Anaerosacchariphilus polymeriproducens]|uniref:Stage 0 sporulation protein A homolog n=1 Tax=Anaerosacchariphilus polymeriproducens TaxID=1812858 RepID=A0A371ATV9_9FIRM|nr:response regulator [Anaerosacchariphilus polymeriproducens]RDU22982.1 response regulator [Anaerosacchariphilus polymeriproducens]
MLLENAKVLISDDSILARKQLKDLLFDLGCTNVFEANNGQVAIDTYMSEKPNLVFLDIVMPVKDGIKVTKEIIEFDSDAKIVIVSSVGTQKHLREALEAGACEFIQKPLNLKNLKKIVESMI